MKKRYYKFKKFKYINGIRGAISLFLAVLMLPFLTIAMLLVETGRYNSAISLLDEAMGVSATSTLADYDEYLHKRWGLLATSQKQNTDALYSKYLTENVGVMGNSLSLKNISVQGEYPLSDADILHKQILEFSKLNAPTQMTMEFLDISELIGQLEDLGDFDKLVGLMGNGVGMIDSTIILADNIAELVEDAKQLENYGSMYEEQYTAFSGAVDALCTALQSERPDAEEDPEGAAAYDANITTLRSDAEIARQNYLETVDGVIQTMTSYKEKMKNCMAAGEGIWSEVSSAGSTVKDLETTIADKQKEVDELEEKIKNMKQEGISADDEAYVNALKARNEHEKKLAELKMEEGISKATQAGGNSVIEGWNASLGTYNDAVMGQVISVFEEIKKNVQNFDVNAVNAETGRLDETLYHQASVSGYVSAEALEGYLQDQEQQLKNGGLSALIDGLTSFYDSIMEISIFYNPQYSAYIDINYYNNNLGGLLGAGNADGGVKEMITQISQTITSIQELKTSLATLNFVNALREIKEVIMGMIGTIQALVGFAAGICRNILDLFSNGYERLYYSTYITFNLPCRTEDSFTCMTGYTVSGLPQQNTVGNSGAGFADLAALIDAINHYAEGTGDDLTFSGAELEYILYGSNSEVANQLYTFFAIYLIRALLDIAPVVTNGEVQSLATASTFAYPVVMGVIILLEALAETILLANGSEVSILDKTVFISPTGIPDLLEEFASVIELTSEQKEDLKSGLVNAFGATDEDYDYQKYLNDHQQNSPPENDDNNKEEDPSEFSQNMTAYLEGLLKFDYREYCFIILLLTVTKEQQMARLSNLIQMETLYYYQQEGVEEIFDLRNAYTYLYTKADVQVNQMLPAMIDSDKFRVTREQYRGY